MAGPLLRSQPDISHVVPMPTDRADDASTITAVSGETLTWLYVSSSAWASATGQAAGTLVQGKLAYTGVLSSSKGALGSFNNTSLSFGASTRFDTLVSVPEQVFDEIQFLSPTDQKAKISQSFYTGGTTTLRQGVYAIDHRRGQIWGVPKAITADDSVSYSYMAPIAGSGGPSSNVNIDKIAGAAALLDDAAFGVGTSGVVPPGFLADETGTDSVNEGDVGVPRITLDRKQINASEFVDDTAFTPASSYVTAIGAQADETGTDSVDEGDVGGLRMTLDRKLWVAPAGNVASGATDSGNPVKIGGVYNSSAPTLTNGQRGDLQLDASANAKMAEAYVDGFVDNILNKSVVEHRYSYARVTADTQVKSSAGFIHSITIAPTTATPTAGLLTVYDNTAESGTVVYTEWIFATDVGHTILLDVSCATGIYIGFDGTLANVSATVSYR
jgi:hypothetical protein